MRRKRQRHRRERAFDHLRMIPHWRRRSVLAMGVRDWRGVPDSARTGGNVMRVPASAGSVNGNRKCDTSGVGPHRPGSVPGCWARCTSQMWSSRFQVMVMPRSAKRIEASGTGPDRGGGDGARNARCEMVPCGRETLRPRGLAGHDVACVVDFAHILAGICRCPQATVRRLAPGGLLVRQGAHRRRRRSGAGSTPQLAKVATMASKA